MKKLIPLVLVLFFFWGNAIAQDNKITITDFYHNEKDRTAITAGTIVLDSEGEKCALIKVMTNLEGFVFDVGALGVRKTVQKIGEIWVYVPYGSKKLKISHPTLATLQYEFPTGPAKKGATYIMQLHANEVFDQVVEDDTKIGKLNFNIYPKDAHVIINAVPVMLDTAGRGEVNLYYGRYTYKITATNHYPYTGRIRISNQAKEQKINISLKRNYGWLKIDCPEGLEEAELFIDGMKLENIGQDSIIVKSGSRTLRIENPLYVPLEEEIVIKDTTTTKFSTRLIPNFGLVRFTADTMSNIYVNGKFLSKGSWEGALPAGIHTIECRAESHIPSSLQISVIKGAPVANYKLENPTPIYGTLKIGTTPEGADIYLDGKHIGTTGENPLVVNNILIGQKQLVIREANYSTTKDTVTIVKDSTISRNYILSNKIFTIIRSLPDSSRIFIDGTEIGRTPFADTLNAGIHNIRIVNSRKYVPIKRKIAIDSDNSVFTYTLKEDYVRKNELYFEGILGYGQNVNYGGAIGGYLRNINFEGGITLGGESEQIYWNPVNQENGSAQATTYSPMNIWGKTGLGIHISGKVRITPQVGIQVTTLTENSKGDTFCDQANCISGMLACRFSVALAPAIGISFTPEYRFNAAVSDGYRTLAGLSEQIDSYNKGINAKVGLFFFF